jgi:hypothetical protein
MCDKCVEAIRRLVRARAEGEEVRPTRMPGEAISALVDGGRGRFGRAWIFRCNNAEPAEEDDNPEKKSLRPTSAPS